MAVRESSTYSSKMTDAATVIEAAIALYIADKKNYDFDLLNMLI